MDSRSVSIRLKVYRQLKVPGFVDSAGTQEFTLLLNDLFDILNSKIPAAGIRNGSPKIKGVNYILTASLNQDPLERFFGLVRSFGGDEDHPTVAKFSQLFPLLALYTPIKLATKGNCEAGQAGTERVLMSTFESLGAKRCEALQKKKSLKEEVWRRLTSIPLRECSNRPEDHVYSVPLPEKTALYYLAGYVVRKVLKATR
ncbi:hypothetical protein HPB51_020229 [Rhipicephalus microplus]|uniref:Uncharacterized protein n=1 Tax=Rhipicephalus microplus TaxID=6941 RepID=A0A9J6F7G6_RHIMP|nr:hypothetical protein HPB51_020229 [Rhipicephalus microplus]